MNQSAEKKSGVAAVLRILAALGLFAVVLSLVPIRDRLHWPSQLGEEPVTGTIRHVGPDEVQFSYTDDAGQLVTFRFLAREGNGWSHVEISKDGTVVVAERALTEEEREKEKLKDEPEEGLVTTLRNLALLPFLGALLLYLVAGHLSFLRWQWLLHAVHVPAGFWRIQKLGFLGLFFSNIIPGMTGGDLVKAIYVARDHRGQRAEAVFSVLVDRAIGLFGLALLGAIALLLNLGEFRDLAPWVFGLLLVMIVASCVLFSRRLRKLLRFDEWVPRLPGGGLLQKVDRAVLLYRKATRPITVAVLVSLVIHFLVLTAIGMVGLAVGVDIAFRNYYVLSPLPLIIQSIPLAPAGIGVGEAAFVYFFARRAGLMQAQTALAMALAYRAVQFLISLVGGVLLLFSGERRVTAVELAEREESGEKVDLGRRGP